MKADVLSDLDAVFGGRARTARQLRRLSLRSVEEVAQSHGFKLFAQDLSKLERGLKRWNTVTLEAVAAGLGVPVEVITEGLELEPRAELNRCARLLQQVADRLGSAGHHVQACAAG